MSKTHLVLAFVALIALRIAIGFHFYKEGTSKLQSGTFTAEYFLRAAKGPFAPYYHGLVDDPEGRMLLCVDWPQRDEGSAKVEVDPEFTFLVWEDFVDRAVSYYRFGDPELQSRLAESRGQLGTDIRTARENKDRTVDTAALEAERAAAETSILKIRKQLESARLIYESHQQQLQDWLSANRTELVSHFSTADRLEGFDRDGTNRTEIATYVASLREQVDTIRSDRQKQLNGWKSEVNAIWDSFENQINSLATASQAEKTPLLLHRPFDQQYSRLKMVNTIVPWFDTIVGVLLILGLFTRIAALAAAGFLGSVVLSQPPWIPGTQSTYYESVELFALLVVFALCAGRYGGLDFFLHGKKTRSPEQMRTE